MAMLSQIGVCFKKKSDSYLLYAFISLFNKDSAN